MPNAYRKKLIEVSLPLEAINKESAREKSIRHGHPSTLHLWWARRPLAACRAVLWSSLVDDPSEYMPDEESANRERERLFAILEDLVKWENINNEEVLDAAKLEIARSVARDLGCEVPVGKQAVREFLATKAPPVLDPFAGGGSIPLEAQRLGLRAYASDLNPVAVLINKALIEIPPKFAGMPPVHPPEPGQEQASLLTKEWKGAEGLAEDVRYYGKWMRNEAEKRIGHLYPKVKITAEMLAEREDLRKQGLKVGDELTVIAWLWARTVISPNPVAKDSHVPLVKSFWLSNNPKRRYWIEPVVIKPNRYRLKIRYGEGNPIEGTVLKGNSKCLLTNTAITREYIRNEGLAGRLGTRLLAIVADGKNGRIYLDPQGDHEIIAQDTIFPEDVPDTNIIGDLRYLTPVTYGLRKHKDLFTARQQTALSTLISTLSKTYEKVESDSLGNSAYANAICTYLAFACDKIADRNSTLCSWATGREHPINTFTRSAYSMVWDFTEINIFSDGAGSFISGIRTIEAVLQNLDLTNQGSVSQRNARLFSSLGSNYAVVSTDPPYYDNVPYADLSDYFYIWIRQALRHIYPDLLSTLLVPKVEELVADAFRQGNKENAKTFFEEGIRTTFQSIRSVSVVNIPTTIYYAFKQVEDQTEDDYEEKNNQNKVSTGWETLLEGLLISGWVITGTWPVRTELMRRMRNLSSNALASSIVLVCRPRPKDALTAIRREFLAALKRELPPALRQLQLGNIAPVDLAQAAIGPGMAIFSRYQAVLESDGTPMRVRTALALINQVLDEYLAEQEGDYDGDTRWALSWFEQYSHDAGPFGVAETLSKAKNTSVQGLAGAGFLEARAGKVRLLKRDELDADWDPRSDKRLTVWEAAQYLIRALDQLGEQGAGALLTKLGSTGETARDLAYRLYTICERKGWAQEALPYNMLVVAWPRIKEQAGKGTRQEALL